MKDVSWATRSCKRLEDGTAVYLVGQNAGVVRLDRFLKERIPKMSRASIQKAIRTRVEIGEGRPAKPASLLRSGDVVKVLPVPDPVEDEPTVEIPLLYEDEHLMVVDKPAGLLAHPSNHVKKGSLTYILGRRTQLPVHLVHRLDRETSGVMVIARSSDSARSLSMQMARKHDGAQKEYLAIVFGEMALASGTIDLPIGKAVKSAVYVKRGVNHEKGRQSCTSFVVESRGGGFSLVRARLQTGRRHQIRVHLAAIGHAVVGDKLYGPAESHYLRFIRNGFDEHMHRELLAERQLLHAGLLSFDHPLTGERLTFTAPLPADMSRFAERLSADGDSTP